MTEAPEKIKLFQHWLRKEDKSLWYVIEYDLGNHDVVVVTLLRQDGGGRLALLEVDLREQFEYAGEPKEVIQPMSDILIITYQHCCHCSRHGEKVVDRVASKDGVGWPVKPVCIEKGAQLVEVDRQVQ